MPEKWDSASSEMVLRVEIQMRENAAGKEEEWYVVDLMIGDKVAGHGEAANIGVLSSEGQCEATATVYALFDFSRHYQKDLKRVYIRPREDPGATGGPVEDREGGGTTPEPPSVDWHSVLGRPDW